VRAYRGLFITIEGGDGAGKSSIIEGLRTWLLEQGHQVVTTREPGGIPIAEAIRSVILDRGNTGMEARTEALLYAAARRQHLVEKVVPALQSGAVVLCDRFVDSSLAYQGQARGLGIDAVWEINRFAIEDVMPDITLYMDIDPEVGLARIRKAGVRELDRLDLESVAFHRKVREGYGIVSARFPDRIATINAEGTPEEVLHQAIEETKRRIKGFSHIDVK
jgi:dTMP kinase